MMEVEDPLSSKFRTTVEALMIKTTSEIVKVFADVMQETRMEISRSWREINDLREKLEQMDELREKQQVDNKYRNQTTQVSVKTEENDRNGSLESSMIQESIDSRAMAQILEDGTVEKMDSGQDDTSVLQQETTQIATPVSVSPIQALTTISPQQPSTTNNTILGKSSPEKDALMHETRMLRDRQLLSSQKPCMCCSLGKCSKLLRKESKSKKHPTETCFYICKDCGAKFQNKGAIKSHKCSSKLKCSRCGQTFSSLSSLSSHTRHVPPNMSSFPYKCYLCDHMFATLCGWNIHKRFHAHDQNSDILKPVEVRLERISETQLEAALFPKASVLLDDDDDDDDDNSPNVKILSSFVEPSSSTGNSLKPATGTTRNASMLHTELVMKCKGSRSRTELSESVKLSNDGSDDTVFPGVAINSQTTEKLVHSRTVTEYNEASSSASDYLSKGNSVSRKRKISGCNHDIYNGVFPVEKIIRWRNVKGRNEVRIKWLPCSLCGAKWKNTWEPAESFISSNDCERQEAVNTDTLN